MNCMCVSSMDHWNIGSIFLDQGWDQIVDVYASEICVKQFCKIALVCVSFASQQMYPN